MPSQGAISKQFDFLDPAAHLLDLYLLMG